MLSASANKTASQLNSGPAESFDAVCGSVPVHAEQRIAGFGADRNLAIYFAIAYAAQGISQQFGLIAQPLQFFMMKGLAMSAADVSAALAVMMLPWAVKPIYGLVCDFLPLFSYRRKSYLFVFNCLAAVAFFVLGAAIQLSAANVLACLIVTAVGMAVSTALMVGLAVADAGKGSSTRGFFAGQAFWYYSLNVAAAVAGGFLCQNLPPVQALKTAALIAMVPPLVVAIATPFLVKEEETPIDRAHLTATWRSLRSMFVSPTFWAVALFLWCWQFSPAFGVALYFFESKSLGFSQHLIGQLGAWNAAGMLTGSIIYWHWINKSFAIRTQLVLMVATGTVSTLGYLLICNPASAIGLELLRGTANMIAILSLYGLAADICPRRTAVSVMACLIAIYNLSTECATFTGGYLFTHLFQERLAPLVAVSAATTLACGLLIRFLPLSDDDRGKGTC